MHYDYIIVGAGSVGIPLAYYLGLENQKVLVLEHLPSPGQGNNKAAIGGIRSSHSEPVKVLLCQETIRIIREWELQRPDELEYQAGGYLYVARREEDLQSFGVSQEIMKRFNIPAHRLSPSELPRIVPAINPDYYRGGLYCPEDINISPLKSSYAFYLAARRQGVEFRFNQTVQAIISDHSRIRNIVTQNEHYTCGTLILANGSTIRGLGRKIGLDIPVYPDSHEAGISAPYQSILKTMIVDISPDEEFHSRNFYFIQNKVGAFIFCYTPYQSLDGTQTTSEFMPVIARRMIRTMPVLKDLYIRRTWRGSYPNTPDGVPIADKIQAFENLYVLGGMCGQGVMLGPGLAKNFSAFILNGSPLIDSSIFARLRFHRRFDQIELLK
ncbi:MAG: FAD-binding oxidoreductase [Candidatus Delongbacteria bacterium]|nr:FAD-binding oxidoreductase [Candidatus Delongbacteria bacterium]